MISFLISAVSHPTQTIESIQALNVEHEILVSPFTGKLCEKKNALIKQAKYENLVIMHDYIIFDPDWAEKVLAEERPWTVMMNQILNLDGSRYRDWCAWDDPASGEGWPMSTKWGNHHNKGQPSLVPYTYDRTQYMYISGAYWVAKRDFMLNHLLKDDLDWGEGEDVEWSFRARKEWTYIFNPAIVRLTKQKGVILPHWTP